MKQKNGMNKISQIIYLSNNYLSHKKNLTKVKGLVDHSSTKRNVEINQYLTRKVSYRQARSGIDQKIMLKENQKMVKRLINITDRKNQSRSSTRSNQSMRSMLDQVNGYKTRRSFIKSKIVQEQNSRIGQRIQKAHFKEGLGPKNYANLKRQNNNYKKVHSRFSQRSQSQMKQILDELKYDHKKIPFLPVLSSRRYSKN